MDENKFSGEILDTVWKLEKIAIDFHGNRIDRKQFIGEFSDIALELTLLLIKLHQRGVNQRGKNGGIKSSANDDFSRKVGR